VREQNEAELGSSWKAHLALGPPILEQCRHGKPIGPCESDWRIRFLAEPNRTCRVVAFTLGRAILPSLWTDAFTRLA
jgi:hypothetical protein